MNLRLDSQLSNSEGELISKITREAFAIHERELAQLRAKGLRPDPNATEHIWRALTNKGIRGEADRTRLFRIVRKQVSALEAMVRDESAERERLADEARRQLILEDAATHERELQAPEANEMDDLEPPEDWQEHHAAK